MLPLSTPALEPGMRAKTCHHNCRITPIWSLPGGTSVVECVSLQHRERSPNTKALLQHTSITQTRLSLCKGAPAQPSAVTSSARRPPLTKFKPTLSKVVRLSLNSTWMTQRLLFACAHPVSPDEPHSAVAHRHGINIPLLSAPPPTHSPHSRLHPPVKGA